MINLYPGVALITGAASGMLKRFIYVVPTNGMPGMGQATAVSFVREGCRKIVISDLNDVGLEETATLIEEADEWGDAHCIRLKMDVTNEEQVQALIDKAVNEFGRIDYAINAAGILNTPVRSHETSLSDFDRINTVNYRGCWLCSRAEITQMLKQEPLPTHDGRPGNRGSIVNFASQLSIVGREGMPAYCASKAAVRSMTQTDAIDYSKDNIRINCVCPGIIATPMSDLSTSSSAAAIATTPMKRAGTAQEVADAVLFLSSSKATFVQGSAMVVDGGYTVN